MKKEGGGVCVGKKHLCEAMVCVRVTALEAFGGHAHFQLDSPSSAQRCFQEREKTPQR